VPSLPSISAHGHGTNFTIEGLRVRLALDTNILVYAEGLNGNLKERAAEQILKQLPTNDTFIPVQALGELFRVLVRKAGRKPEVARASVLNWQDSFPVIETSLPVLLAATDLSLHHFFDIWDAVILAAAASATCRLLLSEDMHDGFTWSGVTIVNPFAWKEHELLGRLLET